MYETAAFRKYSIEVGNEDYGSRRPAPPLRIAEWPAAGGPGFVRDRLTAQTHPEPANEGARPASPSALHARYLRSWKSARCTDPSASISTNCRQLPAHALLVFQT